MVLLTKEDYRMIRRAMDHRREITLTRKVQGAAATVIIHAAPPVGGVSRWWSKSGSGRGDGLAPDLRLGIQSGGSSAELERSVALAKCIKSITAGPLHLEILGKVPGPSGRRRSRRQGPTSPAQVFYNLKCSWRELELTLAANFGGKDRVLVFTYDDAHLPKDKRGADLLFQKFVRRYRAVRRRRGEELRYVYNTEGFHELRSYGWLESDGELEDRRFHHHVVLNFTSPGDLEEIRSLWQGGGYVRAEPLDVHYYRELAKYMTKEAREFGKPRPGERTWRGSRNLEKYQVEYIYISSDSVTLAPPAGAVDYETFSERNPYGFADCVGARYLLFPEREPGRYTYDRGRRRRQRDDFSA